MKVIIEANAKEVADLVAALQGRLGVVLNPARLAEAIRSATPESTSEPDGNPADQ